MSISFLNFQFILKSVHMPLKILGILNFLAHLNLSNFVIQRKQFRNAFNSASTFCENHSSIHLCNRMQYPLVLTKFSFTIKLTNFNASLTYNGLIDICSLIKEMSFISLCTYIN